MNSDDTAPKWAIIAAFTALYIIWGSTYLGIKVAIETIPPFLMSTARFVVAGAILYGLARLKGATRPTAGHWKHSAIVGALLVAGGNGIVAYTERWIDSSMAALIIASNPLFMALFGWWAGVQSRPNTRTWWSLAGGFTGVALLILFGKGISVGESISHYLFIIIAVIFWTGGSIYSKRHPQTISPWLQSGMQMLCGGIVCLLTGLALGEFNNFDPSAISARSYLAFVYLILVGSLVGFTSYVYLLKHCSASAVSSHAYVNPVVAVILGWLILDEKLTTGGLIASSLILVSVYVLLGNNRTSVSSRASHRPTDQTAKATHSS